jgi:hypothetical protein
MTDGHDGSERRARADSPVPRYSIPPPSPATSQFAADKHSKTHGRRHFRRNENLMSHRDIRPSDVPESWRIGLVLAPGQALAGESIWHSPASLIARAGQRLLSRTLVAM